MPRELTVAVTVALGVFRCFTVFVVLSQGCFVVAVVLAYLAFFAPVVNHLNTDLATTRSSLLWFPDEVVSGVPALRALMKDLVKVKG